MLVPRMKRRYSLPLPHPAVFAAAFIAAMLSSPLARLLAQYPYGDVWAWIVAALLGIIVVYCLELLFRRVFRRKVKTDE